MRWIPLRDSADGPSHRCVAHSVEFRLPATCNVCDEERKTKSAEQIEREDRESAATGVLPYVPGLPTSIEDELKLREMAAWFLRKARSSGGASKGHNSDGRFAARVKYAELALRAHTAAAAMAERREQNYHDERRTLELKELKAARKGR